MTKKHYKALAEMVRKVPDKGIRDYLVREIGNLCAMDNPNFDWARWTKACEVEIIQGAVMYGEEN